MSSQGESSTRIRDLIAALLSRTSNREVRWRRTDHPNTFTVVFSSGFVNVRSLADSSFPEPRFRLTVFSSKGEETQEWTTLPRTVSMQDPDRYETDKAVEQLFLEARDVVESYDETVEGILKELRGGW